MEKGIGSSWISWANTKRGGEGGFTSAQVPAYARPPCLSSFWSVDCEGRGKWKKHYSVIIFTVYFMLNMSDTYQY